MTINRDYGNGIEPAKFFTGIEVEHSPAFGLPTLFVVGKHDPAVVLANLTTGQFAHQHVYFGANMSFDLVDDVLDDVHGWRDWEWMIEEVLDCASIKYVTLDLAPSQLESFLDRNMSCHNKLIPMISVKLPYTRLLNYNTTIKIDDVGFDKTNPGVWCHSLHKLMDRDAYTPWSAYLGDNPVTTPEIK